MPTIGSEQEVETQITLSDAAFYSQGSASVSKEDPVKRIRLRKEAYKMARRQSSSEHAGLGLVSSRSGHGQEELEL